ncbi:2-amino-4-hydroxy-6-hydroxymethyldihydropteridine diphosphokinase [Oceanispirochaeta sp.]|uniref:2-amino-4-hydroxy-6- hydroxymethyldihydropteridine diphosphokinase n=1 Tax=Oceanispirochaeta sp. TaxID=2035350 RepID=UPI0026093FF1|nr:2-amino-4-hydroxy-6-hydroxymethyldihydropteridine diphosphokinase [Oceanispirochaeta sp.]MDA3955376.1 2-amino-4-hydroxy-6-hydroxymethyldihydropteridine diphosphokinase [Oceanispirochaeta sp.]
MKAVRVYIGVGSNLGNRFDNLHAAWDALDSILVDADFSSLWETQAMILLDQPPFYNMVFTGLYKGSSYELLSDLQRVEAFLGRKRSIEVPKGPRTLDLDILFFGDEHRKDDRLTLPHPGVNERAFVLTPLLELFPRDNPEYKRLRESLDIRKDQGIRCQRNRSVGAVGFWTPGESENE